MATESTHTLPFQVEEVQDQLYQLRTASKNFQFKTAIGLLTPLLTVAPGLKAAVRVFRNSLVSFSEGLTDHTLTKKEALPQIQEAFEDLQAAFDSLVRDLTKEVTTDEVLYDLGPTALKEYDKDMNGVQVKLSKDGVFVGYCPVLPITAPPLDPRKLTSFGIKAETFAGYCILKRQLVVGISNDMLRPRSKAERDKLTPKELAAYSDAQVEELRQLVLKRYRGMKLVELAAPTAWWGARWIWFMPSSDFKLLSKCTISPTSVASVKVNRWSFPFKR